MSENNLSSNDSKICDEKSKSIKNNNNKNLMIQSHTQSSICSATEFN